MDYKELFLTNRMLWSLIDKSNFIQKSYFNHIYPGGQLILNMHAAMDNVRYGQEIYKSLISKDCIAIQYLYRVSSIKSGQVILYINSQQCYQVFICAPILRNVSLTCLIRERIQTLYQSILHCSPNIKQSILHCSPNIKQSILSYIAHQISNKASYIAHQISNKASYLTCSSPNIKLGWLEGIIEVYSQRDVGAAIRSQLAYLCHLPHSHT